MTFSHLRGGPNGWEVFARNSNPMFFFPTEKLRGLEKEQHKLQNPQVFFIILKRIYSVSQKITSQCQGV